MKPLSFEEVEIGDELPVAEPDLSLENVTRFTRAAGMTFARFTDHEAARSEGLPGAIVPGIMSQGILAATVHRWRPGCEIESIDTVFRAPVQVDSKAVCRGVVTEVDADRRTVQIDLTLSNEAGETRVLGTAQVRFQ